MNSIQIRKSRIALAFLLFLVIITQAAGEHISHVNPANVTASDNNPGNYQLQVLNELMSHWSGIFISLNKGDIKNAQENVKNYLQLLQENNNILIKTEGDVYPELIESGNTLNLTMNQVEKLRALYDEGKIAYQNNQTQKAIRIAVEARGIIGDLNSYQDKFVMDSVEQFPGINVTDYQNGLSAYGEVLNNLKKRQQPVELTLFDDSLISLAVHPEEAEFGDVIYIQGVLTTPKNRMGIPDANVTIKIGNRTITGVTTDRFGRYNYTYTVPYNKPGQYPINVEFVPFKEPLLPSYASSSFDLIPANTSLTIEVKPDKGIFGDTIHISGILLLKNESGISDASISISLDNQTIGSVRTDTNGTYTYNLKVRGQSEGAHTLKANFRPDEQLLLGSSAITSIRLIPTNTSLTIEAKPDKGVFGDTIHISGILLLKDGSGMSDASISISLDNQTIGSVRTDINGTYKYNLKVRGQSEGAHTLKANFRPDEQLLRGSSAMTSIRLIATNTNLTILTNPDSVEFNDIMQISGKISAENDLILAGGKIDILLDDQPIDFVNIDDNGEYRYLLKVPPISEGTHIIQAKYITDDALILTSGNNTSITVKPTNTRLNISAPETVHQENYLNISWNVTTDKGYLIKNASITVLFDQNIIGNAIVESGNFYVSYRIDRNITIGMHNITVKYNGNSPFLPSEKTKAIEILEPEFNYNLLYIIGVFGIIIFAFYLKKYKTPQLNLHTAWLYPFCAIFHKLKQRTYRALRSQRVLSVKTSVSSVVSETKTAIICRLISPLRRHMRNLRFKIGSFMSSLNSRIGRAKTPATSPELLKEERTEEIIKVEEPGIEEEKLQEVEKEEVDEKQEKTFLGIYDLIAKSQYNRSISLAYVTVKNKISDFAEINHAQYLTHREFYNIVKDKIPAINDEMKELTEFYEQAMYSGIKVNKEHALKCAELAKNIINKLGNEK